MKETDRIVIKKMPDKETLEEFINGMNRRGYVYFDIEKGEFTWEEGIDSPRSKKEKLQRYHDDLMKEKL